MGTDFRRDYLLKLPLPLAQLYSRAHNAKNARARHDNCYFCFEAAIKLSTAALTAAYLDRGDRNEIVDKQLSHLALPSLGHWHGMQRELARHFEGDEQLGQVWAQLSDNRGDLLGALGLFRRIKNGIEGKPANDSKVSLLNLFDAVVRYRNEVMGHGGPRFDDFYETVMGPLLFPALNDVLGAFDVLGAEGVRLVYLTELRSHGHGFELGARELVGLQGERMAPIPVARDEAEQVAPNRCAILWPDRTLPLRIDPLLRFRESEIADEVLFLNRDRRGKQVEYLSYTTGRTERADDTADALSALLAAVGHARPKRSSVASKPESDYEILGELGRGGMGVVYLARQLSLGRIVALKTLATDVAEDHMALSRFRREMRALAKCDHPNIIKVMDSGTLPDGRLYYTMEYVAGCDLDHVWRELTGAGPDASSSTFDGAVHTASERKRESLGDIPLPPMPELPAIRDDPGGYVRRIVELGRDAARALQAVHEQGIVHRDVSPQNLVLTPDAQRVVLMDFGLAKSATIASMKTQAFVGKLRYAAPEQLAAAMLDVGPAADIRGLGVTMWELLTFKRLFDDAEDERRLATLIHERDVPRLRDVDPSFDVDLEAVIARATERRPDDRIATAGRLADYLELYLEGKPLPIRPPSTGEMVRRWVREHRGRVFAAFCTLLTIVGLVIVSFILITAEKRQAEEARDTALAAEGAAQAARHREKGARKLAEESARIARERAILQGAAGSEDPLEAALLLLELDRAPDDAALSIAHDVAAQPRPVRVFRFDAPVSWSRLSPDGKRILTGSFESVVRLWEVDDPVRPIVLRGHTKTVTSAFFNRQGTKIVTASMDRTARIWNADGSGEPIVLRAHKGPVLSVGFSRNGRKVVTTCIDGGSFPIARVWNVDGAGKPKPFPHFGDLILGAALSDDGKRIATACQATIQGQVRATVLVRNVDGTGKQIVLNHLASGMRFTPDGKKIVTMGLQDSTTRVWNADGSGRPVVLRGHEGFVYWFDLSTKAKRIVTASWDRTARIWNADGFGEPVILRGHTDAIKMVRFSPDSTRVVTSGADRTVRIWNADGSGEPIVLRGHKSWVFANFTSDGKHVFSGSADGTARLWKARHTGLALRGHAGWAMTVRYSPDGRKLVTSSYDGTVRIWNADATGIPIVYKGFSGLSTHAEFSPDSKRVIASYQNGRVMIWPVARTARHRELRPGWSNDVNKSVTRKATFSPDGKLIAIADFDDTARVFFLDGSREERELSCDEAVFNVVFSPDSQLVATAEWDAERVPGTADDDCIVRVFRVDGEAAPLKLKGHNLPVQTLVFSHDSKLLLTASQDSTARIWSADKRGEKPILLEGHSGPLWTAAFSPDEKRVVTASSDKTVRIWNADGSGESLVLSGFSAAVTSARFSRDGKRIITTSADRTVQLRNADGTGLPVILRGHTGPITAGALSPDGKQLATIGWDNTVRLWYLTWDGIRDYLRRTTPGTLTPTQRLRHLGEK